MASEVESDSYRLMLDPSLATVATLFREAVSKYFSNFEKVRTFLPLFVGFCCAVLWIFAPCRIDADRQQIIANDFTAIKLGAEHNLWARKSHVETRTPRREYAQLTRVQQFWQRASFQHHLLLERISNSQPAATIQESANTKSEVVKTQVSDYAAHVRAWAERVVIGFSLCPWAVKAHSEDHLKFVTCEGNKPSDVARMVKEEADRLTLGDIAPLSSVLIVCPHVTTWKNFSEFQAWVNDGIYEELPESEADQLGLEIRLELFHPEYVRNRALADEIRVGSVVQSHYAVDGFKGGAKSVETVPATVVDTNWSSVVGSRQVGIRFHVDDRIEYVPNEWLSDSLGAPLPDNAMQRAPYPTVQLIRGVDLDSVDDEQIDVVETHNAKLIDKLGWEGLRKAFAPDDGTVADQRENHAPAHVDAIDAITTEDSAGEDEDDDYATIAEMARDLKRARQGGV